MADVIEQTNDVIKPSDITNKFNWGAFFLTWIWGLGNKTYKTLLVLLIVPCAFIPFVNNIIGLAQLGLSIWFGIKGNEWAWQNKQFSSVKDFHANQKKWAIAGIIYFIISLVIGFIFTILVAMSMMSAK